MAMTGNKAVVGVFSYVDDCTNAIKKAKELELDFRVYAPVPVHALEHYCAPDRSPVRFINGVGAVIGLTFGFALAILCSMDWPMRVSAKDIISIPGFVVIGYECTILFGAIATLLSLLHFCRLPDILHKVGYDPRFSCDKFGLVIGCDSSQIDQVKSQLQDAGAEEVSVRDGL